MIENKFDKLLAEIRHSEPYLQDNGFAAGVPARLPEARELPLRLKNTILLLFTALGSCLSAWQFPVYKLVGVTVTDLFTYPVLAAAGFLMFALSCAITWLSESDYI